MEKQMKTEKQRINEIIKYASVVMAEFSDLMEAYEMPDYAEKCESLDKLWFAIDEYLQGVKDDDDEMEDLGLS